LQVFRRSTPAPFRLFHLRATHREGLPVPIIRNSCQASGLSNLNGRKGRVAGRDASNTVETLPPTEIVVRAPETLRVNGVLDILVRNMRLS